jgi:hypothetical protein
MSTQLTLKRLVALFPGFAEFWNDPGNCYREDDGSFNHYGVFNEFYSYFTLNRERFPDDRLAALGALVSEYMTATGFLEGASFDPAFARHLRGEALRYYQQWH